MLPKKKLEYLRVANRFLKEVGLYPYWIKYLNDPKSNKSWIVRKDIRIVDILGSTCFTDYLIENNRKFEKLFTYTCVYEVFVEYLMKAFPEEYDTSGYSHTNDFLTVDMGKKKIIFNKR